VEVIDLGLIDYKKAYDYQIELVEKRRNNLIKDTLVILEHYPVITMGRSAKKENLLSQIEGVPVFSVDRGGDITAHFPGQVVVYPIIDLKTRGRDVHKYLRDLEQVVINFLGIYGIKGARKNGFTGVYVNDEKICSIGIGVKNWITFHGFALNVGSDLSIFDAMVPCGIKGIRMTSMEKLLGINMDRSEVHNKMSHLLESSFLIES